MATCIACKKIISSGIEEYQQCEFCGTYCYLSKQTADELNKIYFNETFKGVIGKKNKAKEILFRTFNKTDEILHREYKESKKVFENNKRKYINNKICIVEIGFGNGNQLIKFLKNGIDAYGIDISETAVEQFKNNYPEFKDRVSVGQRMHRKVSVVYCSALFEHLDEPQKLIDNVYESLCATGVFIIQNLPIVNESNVSLKLENDISFWEPFHKAVYSLKGLKIMFERRGFKLINYSLADEYNYRLMSLHLQEGFKSIRILRNTVSTSKELPCLTRYIKLCIRALKAKSSALNGNLVFKKLI